MVVTSDSLERARHAVLDAVKAAESPVSSPRELEDMLGDSGLGEELILVAVWDLISRGQLRLAEGAPNLEAVAGNSGADPNRGTVAD